MSKLHEEFPNKNIYFSEGSTFGTRGAVQIISFLRHWARSYNAWVTMIDLRAKPNRGPHDYSPTCIVLNSETLQLDYRSDYYIYGQFMKFIQPDAVRIASTASAKLPHNVAFRNPDGSMVLVAANPEGRPQPLTVLWNQRGFTASLGPKSVSTFTWSGQPGPGETAPAKANAPALGKAQTKGYDPLAPRLRPKDAAPDRQTREREARRLKVRIAELERKISDQEKAVRDLEQMMASPGFYADRAAPDRAVSERQALLDATSALMSEWESLQGAVEAAR